ncbi:hypothetical protein MCOR27_000025 [Pyricularia oryzae]|uniref:Uncharacterized protein n=1 Tax=Pyricularia grisea TaxID=148305 RepID=A0ABQ8NHD0_PYRGI|nr:hypothetical protein MCOR27_000025 [Pyricularia oryzae]KAI6297103.1 hypothetical protein MCOR33_006489 [Pyricularia grisea]
MRITRGFLHPALKFRHYWSNPRRLIRLGQIKSAHWHLLKVVGSIFDFMERNYMMKWVQEVGMTGDVPEYIQGPMQIIYFYESAKLLLHQSILQPIRMGRWNFTTSKLGLFNNNATRQRGYFYSFIASKLRGLSFEEYEEAFELAIFLEELENAGALSVAEIVEVGYYRFAIGVNTPLNDVNSAIAKLQGTELSPYDHDLHQYNDIT